MPKIKLKSDYFWLAVILLAGFAIRFYGLGLRSLDGDEGVILRIVSGSFGQVWQNFTLDVHPPLFHFLTWFSVHIFGPSEISLRLVSFLAGAVVPVIIFLWLRTTANRSVALAAAFLSAVSPYLLYFSQESRMYSLFILLTTIGLWQWQSFLRQRNFASGFWWILALAAAAWTYHLGIFIGIVQMTWVIACCRKELKKVFAILVTGFILYLPLITKTLGQFSGRISEASPENNFKDNLVGIFNAFYRFVPGRTFLGLEASPKFYFDWFRSSPVETLYFVITFVIPLVLLFHGAYQLRKTKKTFFWQLASIAMPLLILGVVSGEIGPRATRFLSVLYPIVIFAIAYGLSNLRKPLFAAAFALTIAISAVGIGIHYRRDQKAVGAKHIAEFLSGRLQADGAVLVKGAFAGGESEALKFYLAKRQNQVFPDIFDYFGDYRPGGLNILRSQDIKDFIGDLKLSHSKVFFYDFSYQENKISGKMHQLGKDKEGKEVIVWEVN